MKPPERKYRASAIGLGADVDGDPLERPITTPTVFFSTVGHYAGLAGVDRQHLLDTLRLGGQHGVPVTAALIMATATALADAGFRAVSAAVPAPPITSAEQAELACLTRRGYPRRPRAA